MIISQVGGRLWQKQIKIPIVPKGNTNNTNGI